VFAGKGAVVRLDPGPNPPATALAEVYNVALPRFGPRGADGPCSALISAVLNQRA
jgi:hypothetical protein